MQISTTARHCEIAPELRALAEGRLEKLERYARDLREAHLIVTAEKHRTTAEITLHLTHREVVSREEATDARMAIDLALTHVEEQLRRVKEKRIDRRRPGTERENGAAAPSDSSADEEAAMGPDGGPLAAED
jgi:putative sigma-54 modulation protein